MRTIDDDPHLGWVVLGFGGGGRGAAAQRCATFVRNRTHTLVACYG